ncbi:RBBP9/YdeN family alpha/beta hydrolase [Acinetobacter sp. MD2]|uniref:RBBP9/YdeN family alpha/beta hydrolase n=1 Tax=Acinetobacter sp. MD2 TaxID=2600066 RepID=UPI002D1F3D26|nr:alpha/beta hydrolase [Acinetobacter sp. MD2]MEB3766612.1 alpha/beta hydrolase [Acinetobacter sp. MD2]
MTHHLIVPGVGGSDSNHWQSWLQRHLKNSSRVEQQWDRPILTEWIKRWVQMVNHIQTPIEVVAHSFGCLTSIAALAQHPELADKISKLILVAPANPARFGEAGFAQNSSKTYQDFFAKIRIQVPALMLMSENDAWFAIDDARQAAAQWQIPSINLGQVGHINVASGFGPFPEIFDYLEADLPTAEARMRKLTQPLSS